MKPILEIQHISKKFRIRHEKQPYLSIRDSFSSLFKPSKNTTEDFYALQDISFNVNQGDTVGIIGKNGAGKSTLLKILSKITPPTTGKIICRGRIASLLEVGTGFHPELSGRENIFLNGSILGMKRSEIVKNFDAIVDFAGVERFIDTPLKHYSSGMQLRLAFAVAAFLENEILIIDEVLAVGDAEFQKKCLGKMEDVSKSGRTLLFVSHNLSALQSLCNNAIYLEQGELFISGNSADIVKKYLQINISNKQFEKNINSFKETFVEKIEILNKNFNNNFLDLELLIHSKICRRVAIDFRVNTSDGTPAAFFSYGTFNQVQMQNLEIGTNKYNINMDTSSLANGLYYLSIDLTLPDKEYFDRLEQAIFFEVINPSIENGRVLLQSWNYGYYKIPMELKKL